MRSFLLAAVVALPLVACASTGAFDRASSDPARSNVSAVRFDFTARTDEAVPTFPAVVDPRLPSADRVAPRLRHLGGDTLTADIKLCVRPNGSVANVELARSSAVPSFDTAMMRDVADWQFAPMAGPDTVKSCEQFTISYRPHR